MAVRFGLVGYGHWGKNLARVVAQHPDAVLTVIADPGAKAKAAAQTAHPGILLVDDARTLISDAAVDAMVITSPASTHFPMAKAALEAGKHVLITKPVTSTAAEAAQLRDLAVRVGRVAVVDHTFLYHPCVARLKAVLGEPWLGAPLVYDVVRTGLGIYKVDADIIADLAVHDLAILDYLFGPPAAVSAHAYAAIAGYLADNTAITLSYVGALRAHVRSSWISPLKQRLAVLVGAKQMIVWDDTLGSERLRAFDQGVDKLEAAEALGRAPLSYRSNGSRVLTAPDTEPLRAEIDDMISCIATGRTPVSSLMAATRVMEVVEACHASAAQGGAHVSPGA